MRGSAVPRQGKKGKEWLVMVMRCQAQRGKVRPARTGKDGHGGVWYLKAVLCPARLVLAWLAGSGKALRGTAKAWLFRAWRGSVGQARLVMTWPVHIMKG
jgi:hypothetical protein